MGVLCLVFAKPPRPGEAKTRLAAELGPDAAARIAAALLQDTWAAITALPGVRPILSTPEPEVDHGIGDVEAWDQGPGDLGERVERMLRQGIRCSGRAIAVGADGVGAPAGRVLDAVQRLGAGHEAVIGPSDDGGFYLLGLTRCPVGLLAQLPWSDSETFARTTERLLAHGFSPAELPSGWDVDELPDLWRLRQELPRARAPQTHAVLDGLGWPR